MYFITSIKLGFIIIFIAISAPTFAQNCGDVITSDVLLRSNLQCDDGYFIFDVQADNVTIDLNGYTLSGSPSITGILNQGYSNMTVKNGTIKGIGFGVIVSQSDTLRVDNMTFYETGNGVNFSKTDGAIISNNKFIRQSGVSVNLINNDVNYSTNNNRIENNEFYETTLGVRICGANADSNIVTNNLFWRSKSYAVQVETANRNVITNNRILESVLTPIRLTSASYNRISDNTLIGYTRDNGLTTPSGVLIFANSSEKCAGGGLISSVGNSITRNRISDFSIAVEVGTGYYPIHRFFNLPSPYIRRNYLSLNSIIDNEIGIHFMVDAHQNSAPNNNYRGTALQVKNNGIGNTY